MIKLLLNYLFFPGMAFLAAAGMLVSWLDRKVTARIQWRVGPPVLQPFYDVRKLFLKETILPAKGSVWLFVAAPVISVMAILMISNYLFSALMYPETSFQGDLILILYLFMIPPVACIMGALASGNPLASLGASREMKMVLSYELPFLLSVSVAILKFKSISLGEILVSQQTFSSIIETPSGLLAFIVAVLCIQAKMGVGPFDLAEAETELAGGSQIEYSGPLLAFWKLSKMMLMVVAPLLIILIFWAGSGGWPLILKYLAVIVISILIRNTNPRLRIDQAIKFFWSVLTVLAVIALLLHWLGY